MSPPVAMAAASHHPGRIGPNAVTRVVEALDSLQGRAATRTLFETVGLAHYLIEPPQAMVHEDEVRRLHLALRRHLGDARADEIAVAAGRLTADYLLARRIPGPFQALLRRLPAALAARLLLSAISRHAWTFVGSGSFQAQVEPQRHAAMLTVRGNPLCLGLQAQAPACGFYAATFTRLFQRLVHPAATVREIACEACGDEACRFEASWVGHCG